MKKIIISIMILTTMALANGLNLKSCIKTEVDNRTNIFSCQSGDYLVKYKRDKKETLADQNPITKLGDKCLRAEDILRYIKNN